MTPSPSPSLPGPSPLTVAILLSDGLESKGGIGRVMTYLSRELGERHPDIRVVACRSRPASRGLARHLGVPVALARFARQCRARQVDVVHINIARRGSTWRKMLFAGMTRMMGMKLVLHLHGSGYDGYYAQLPRFARKRVSRLFNSADAVIALSPYWRDVLVDHIHVAPEKVHVIGNGVPSPATPEAAAEPPPAVPTILFMGELGERKGIDLLLPALAALSAQGLAWRAVIAGNGAVQEARDRATSLGLAADILFPGWVGEEEVSHHMRKADIFTLPSRAENQPLSILEAMAHGLPVVSTTVGAIPEQVRDGESGFLVPPGDAEALARALARLVRDADLRAAMGEAGRRHFARHYSLAACADRFAALYRSLLPGA